MVTEGGALRDFHVRLPQDVKEKLPAAKIRTGKSIQEFVRDAVLEHMRRVNL